MGRPLSRRKTITNLILLSLEKSIDGYVRFEDFTNHHYRYQYGIPELKKASLAKAFKRLREKGLVELVDDNDIVFRLTNTGKERAVVLSLQEDNQKWDGKWRILIFDVPEQRRLVRDVLRSKLKMWGFVPLQQSVWVTKKNCTEPLKDFIKQIGIKDWVKVFEADQIDL